MTDKLAHVQQQARDLAAKVETLAAGVARRSTPKKVVMLERARARLAVVEQMITREKAKASIKARIAARNVGLMRRLDKLAAAAPAVAKQWKDDRAKEPKRLKKLKAAIAKRTSKDYTARPDWMRKPVTLPPPIEQPVDHDVDVVAPPPREGLIPGTYSVRNPSRLTPLLDVAPLPSAWTAQHVGQRLIDAYATLRCMPERDKPKGYGAMWPAYKNEAGELAIQAGAGTLLLGRNRIRRVPSADEVALMEQAMTWIGKYLSGVTAWARMALISWAEDRDSDPEKMHPAIEGLLQFIADALNRENRMVR